MSHGSEHSVSLLIGFTASDRAVEIVSARITSFIDPNGVEAPSWLMSQIASDETLAASLATAH